MAKESRSYTVNLQVGMQLDLNLVVDLSLGKSGFCKTDDILVDNVKRTLTNGFLSRYENVGYLEIKDSGSPVVTYSHIEAKENVIYFYASTGEIQTIYIVTVPIHDHSSITQGGPAFGTYHSDYLDEEV